MALPRSRALMTDLLYFHRRVPTCAHHRWMDLRDVVAARRNAGLRVSWSVVFLKAYSAVSQRFPELRQCYITWPWPHVYEHPTTLGHLVVERIYQGQPWVLFAPFPQADRQRLVDLQDLLHYWQTGPVEKLFRGQVRLAARPLLIRRALWWFRLNVSGAKRVKRLGTFGLTTLAGYGATIAHPMSPLTSTVSYGPLDENDRLQVTIAYDHRLLDGRPIAECLAALEHVLQTEIRDELASLATLPTEPTRSGKSLRLGPNGDGQKPLIASAADGRRFSE